MTGTIDTRVVELQFDNSNFEKNVSTSIASLKNLNDNLGLDNSRYGARNLSDAFTRGNGSILGAISQVNTQFNAMDIIAKRALERITDYALSSAKKISDQYITGPISTGFNKLGEKNRSIRTILNAVSSKYDGGEEEAMEHVTDTVQKLMWYSDETSYSFTDMISNISKFTSAGGDLEKSAEVMMGIANATAMAGQGSAEASRVMYNMAQAYGSGSVKLIDWKSVENANVATEQLKQTIMDAAVDTGTLIKDKKGNYKTKKGGKKVTTGTFNETLSTGWFSSEVMEAAFGEYSKFSSELYKQVEETGMSATELLETINKVKEGSATEDEIALVNGMISDLKVKATETASEIDVLSESVGAMAFSSAQEAKTFQDAVDAILDVMGTGWMEVFEAFFGDFKESTKIWTAVANEVSSALYVIPEAIADIITRWDILGGKTALFETISSIWETMGKVIGAVADAFEEVFGGLGPIALMLARVTKNVRDFALELNPSEETLEKLKNIFEGIFAIAKIVFEMYLSRIRALKPLIDIIGSLAVAFLNLASPLGKLFVKLSKTLKKNKSYEKSTMRLTKFTKALFKAYEQLVAKWKDSALYKKLCGYFAELDEKFGNVTTEAEALTAAWDWLKKSATAIWESIKNLASKSQILTAIFNKLAPLTKSLSKFLDPIKKKLSGIWEKLKEGYQKIIDWVDGFIDADDKVGYLKQSFADLEKSILEKCDALVKKWDEVKAAYASGGWEGVADVITGDPEMVDGWIAKWNELKETFSKQGIKGVLDTVWADLIAFKEKVLNWLANLFYGGSTETIDEQTGEIIKVEEISQETAREIFDKKLQPHIDALKLWLENAKQAVSDWFGGIWPTASEDNKTSVTDFATQVTSDVETAVETAGNDILTSLTGLKDKVLNFFKTLWSGSDSEEEVSSGVEPIYKNASNSIVESVNESTQFIETAFSGSVDKIESSINDTFGKVNWGSLAGKLAGLAAVFALFKTVWSITGSVNSISDFGGKRSEAIAEKWENIANTFKYIALIILSIGASILMIVGAMKILTTMSPGEIVGGMFVIAIILAGMVAAIVIINKVSSKKSKQNNFSNATTILAMAASLFLIAMAIDRFAELAKKAAKDPGPYIAAFAMVALITVAMVAALYFINKKSTSSSINGKNKIAINMESNANTILALAGSLFIIAGVIERFGKMKPGVLWSGIGALVVIMACIALFLKVIQDKDQSIVSMGTAAGKSSKASKQLGTLVGLALVVWAIGNALLKILLTGASPGKILMAGVTVGLIIVAMAGALVMMNKMGDRDPKKDAIRAASFLILAVALRIVASAMVDILDYSAGQIASAGIVMAAIILAMAGALALVGSELNTNSPVNDILEGIAFVVVAGALWLAAEALTKILDYPAESIATAGGIMSVLILAMAGALTLVGSELNTNSAFEDILEGIAFVAVAGALYLAAEAMVKISEIGDAETIAVCGGILAGVAVAMGLVLAAVSVLTGDGLGALLTGIGFVAIAYALKEAADAMVTISSIGSEEEAALYGAILAAVAAAIGVILVAVSALTFEGVGAILTGIGFVAIAEALKTCADAMVECASIDEEQLKTAETALLAILASMAAVLVAVSLFGTEEGGGAFDTSKIEGFGTWLDTISSALCTAMLNVASALSGITAITPEQMETAKVAMLAILAAMAAAMIAVATFGTGEDGSVNLPDEESVNKLMSMLTEFATKLASLGSMMLDSFTPSLDALSKVDGEKVKTTMTALGEAFTTLFVGGWFSGKKEDAINLISSLAEALNKFNFVAALPAQLTTIMSAIGTFFSGANDFDWDGGEDKALDHFLTTLTEKIGKFAEIKIDDTTRDVISELEKLGNALSNFNNFDSSSASITTTLAAASDIITEIGEKAKDLDSSIATSIRANVGRVTSAISYVMITARNVGTGKASAGGWNTIGKNIVLGIKKGIEDESTTFNKAIEKLIKDAYEAGKKAADINSPSRLFAVIGEYLSLGVAKGVDDESSSVSDSVESMIKASYDSVSESIRSISSSISDDMSVNPVITPVVDLSDVENSASYVNGLFGSDSKRLASSVSHANDARLKAKYEQENQNGANNSTSGSTYSFVQNNYSPKALSRTDIYRQTRNQFSLLKGLTET